MNKHQQEETNKVKKTDSVFIADTARVLGNVSLANNVSIWYGAVLRADLDAIIIDENTNIQENCVLHVDFGKPITIGKNNIVGHGAIIHGATIGNNNLIGMRATILNGATIGNHCIIGAHALVLENMQIPDGSMVLGAPAKIVKTLDITIIDKMIQEGVDEYVHLSEQYLKNK
ncbi:MAG: gamma carbonic anhydrase family protein [Chitinophagales bacterium]|nr:gamma carbonic anhydrase family protein [Chitinophagales bacterium]